MKQGGGMLLDRLRFEARSLVNDGRGNRTSGPFTAQFTRWASIKTAPGRETVLAARLTGVEPVTIRLRYDPESITIKAGWRAIDVVNGTVYALKSDAVNVERRHRYVEMTAEQGVAA